MQEYKKYVFGNKNRIYLYLLSKPMENGMLGIVRSKAFSSQIGIHIKKQRRYDESFDIGGMYISSVNEQPMIWVCEELYLNESLSEALLMTVFHELGHYYNGDCSGDMPKTDETRICEINLGRVNARETGADDFSIRYLGKRRTLIGLNQLIELICSIDCTDNETKKLALTEIKLRIDRINRQSKNEKQA